MISNDQILLFILLVLPGFVTLRTFALLEPVDSKAFKDQILEAISYG